MASWEIDVDSDEYHSEQPQSGRKVLVLKVSKKDNTLSDLMHLSSVSFPEYC